MATADNLGPFKGVVAAATALLAMAAFVMTKWVGFLLPPPPLAFGEKDSFWLPLATVCTGVVGAVVFLFLPWKKKGATQSKVALGILTLVVAVAFVGVSIAYQQQRSKWTFSFQGASVLIGDRHTEAGKIDAKTPGITPPILLHDFGDDSYEVWTKAGLQRRQLRLGVIYVFASLTGGVCFALAAWVVLRFAADYSNQTSQATGPSAKPQPTRPSAKPKATRPSPKPRAEKRSDSTRPEDE